ncbi:ankyrin [Formosa agariphila KMM 3901]|uniref:Ankyrin n=1 Tax=Formosa agariphila (strain DSM 15362 / KCTC 12365 / LMG 23005 / KMM 3901 / M-2Alg 35-1) TaxID=1347342 RepID=T2KPN1_FORAG|nr:ankyrin repeat domain-containing protein [Formosa agariphila]CDF80787.1 ankyrin [Formosa agariphila KMM 3901]
MTIKIIISTAIFLLSVFEIKANELCLAVKSNNLVEASRLLEHGIDVNGKNALGYTPLMLSAGLGNYQMCDLLLSAGADVHILDNRMGATALHKSAQSGVVPVAELLIRHGAFIDMRSPTNGNTPLIDASWYRNAAMVKYLLEAGANYTIEARGTLTAQVIAENAGDKHIVKIIEDYIKKVNLYKSNTTIYTEIENNNIAEIEKLISDGLDINAKADHTLNGALKGITPLLYASRLGKSDIVKLLLEQGANPRIVDWTMKSTVLHKSGYMGHPESIDRLVIAGAELNAQGPYNGYTALHDAVWHGHTKTVIALLDAGAIPNLEGLDGNTPLDLAVKYNYTDIISILSKPEYSEQN